MIAETTGLFWGGELLYILVSINGLDPGSSAFEILRIFWMRYINMYLSHMVAPRRLVLCISTLPGTGQFLTPLSSRKRPLSTTPVNVGIIR